MAVEQFSRTSLGSGARSAACSQRGTSPATDAGSGIRDGAERLREQLGRLEAPVLGVVANGVKVRRGGKYGYGYYGGYYGRPAESAEVGAAEPERT